MQNQKNLIQTTLCHFGCNKFDKIMAHYMDEGYVYAGDDAVILAKKMNKNVLMDDPAHENDLDKKDCWYIQWAIGNPKRFFDVCPEPLEWIVFERWGKSKRRAYKFDKLERYFHGSA